MTHLLLGPGDDQITITIPRRLVVGFVAAVEYVYLTALHHVEQGPAATVAAMTCLLGLARRRF